MIHRVQTALRRLAPCLLAGNGIGAGPARLTLTSTLALTLTLIAQGGCGGGGGVGIDGGGIGGSGYVAGPIGEFGSIVVEGIRFSVDDATIVVNGEPALVDDLALGMFVGVHGTFEEEGTTGTATRVEFEESVSGPIAFASPNRRRIVVLEQSVILHDSTRLDGITFDELRPGVVVTVSGTRDADDAIVATLVASRLPAPGCRVLGDVTELAGDGSSFRIGDLAIDASQAQVIGGALVEGDNVGVLADSCQKEGSLIAREIRRLEVTRPPLPGPLRSVRGFAIEAVSEGRFRMHVLGVGRLVVAVLPRTVFEGGAASDIARNQPLRVTGVVGDAGALRAARIRFLDVP